MWEMIVAAILALILISVIAFIMVGSSKPAQDINQDLICKSAIELSNSQGLQLDYTKCKSLIIKASDEKDVVDSLFKCDYRLSNINPKYALKSYPSEFNKIISESNILALNCANIELNKQISFGSILNQKYKDYKYITYLTNNLEKGELNIKCFEDNKEVYLDMNIDQNYIIYNFIAKYQDYQNYENFAKYLIGDEYSQICDYAYFNNDAIIFVYDDSKETKEYVHGLLLAKSTFKLNPQKVVYYKIQGELNE